MLTFNDLPASIDALHKKLGVVERMLIQLQNKVGCDPDDENRPINVKDAAKYLDLETATLYSKISRGQIPYFKRDKRVYFTKKLLNDYLAQGRKKSSVELEEEALNAIKKRGADQ